MDFDNPKVYGDTSIFDGLVSRRSVIDRVVVHLELLEFR